MLELRTLEDPHFNNLRNNSSEALSPVQPPAIDINSSTTDQSLYMDPSQEPHLRYYHHGSTTLKLTSLQSHQPTNKEKSSLCRKYIDVGSCPYGYKCKFAHGAHELRQNQQANNRYKTKECGSFFRDGYCRFGNRCNFLHTKPTNGDQKKATFLKILGNHRDCIHSIRDESRLLQLLVPSPQ